MLLELKSLAALRTLGGVASQALESHHHRALFAFPHEQTTMIGQHLRVAKPSFLQPSVFPQAGVFLVIAQTRKAPQFCALRRGAKTRYTRYRGEVTL
jgi:hypothetical protein